jgi:hypothetical protein
MLGLLRVLDQDDAAGFLDGLDPDRTIGAGPRQDDGKPVTVLPGQ